MLAFRGKAQFLDVFHAIAKPAPRSWICCPADCLD
jgi:hypothetical protein